MMYDLCMIMYHLGAHRGKEYKTVISIDIGFATGYYGISI